MDKNKLLDVFLPFDIYVALRNTILVTLVSTIAILFGTVYWTTNRQTQITKSKSQQKHRNREKKKDPKVQGRHGDGDDYDYDSDASVSREEQDELYFNDWTRSNHRRQMMHAIHGGDDDYDNADDDSLEASDDDGGDDEDEADDDVLDNDAEFDVKFDRDSPSQSPSQSPSNGESSKLLRLSLLSSPSSPQRKMRKDLFQAISKLKVFSYMSDEAFMQSLEFMEYVDLPDVGMEVFQDEPYDGSLYVLIEGRVNIRCSLQSSSTSTNEEAGGEPEPMSLSAGPGDLVTSLLSALSGLIQEYQGEGTAKDKEGVDDFNRDSEVRVRATTLEKNTRLIRIPPQAFVSMLKSYPHDVYQIAQTILARCQRVTVRTLVNNLGMGLEILYTHRNRNRTSTMTKSTSKNSKKHNASPVVEEKETKEKVEVASIAQDILKVYDHQHGSSDDTHSCIKVGNEIMERIAKVASHSLGSTAQSVVDTIRNKSSIAIVKPGEVIVSAETKSEYVYFVIHGSIAVCTIARVGNESYRDLQKQKLSNNQQDENKSTSFRPLYKVLPGQITGQMSCFTDEVSFATLTSSGDEEGSTILLQLPKISFRALVDNHPKVMIQCISKILTFDFSPLIHLFEWGIDWKHIQAGTLLATKGETCDKLQVVLSGRLRSAPQLKYESRVKTEDEYGRGSCIGEALVILGAKWASDVYAIRNSEIAILPVNVLEYIMHMFPHTALYFARRIAARKEEEKHRYRNKSTLSFSNGHELSVATLAIVPLCFDSIHDARELCDQIVGGMKKIEPCSLMTKSIARRKVGERVFNLRNAVHELKMSRLLGDLEEGEPLNVYQTDSKFTWWTKFCIQQADCVLLVIDSQKVPSCRHLERYLAWAYDKQLVRHVQVVVLQQVKLEKRTIDSSITTETRIQISHEVSAWIESRHFIEGQHLLRKPVKVYENDVARMCRRITGRSLGLALGGGGARGLAHVGVIRALMERGVSVDICGGTSQGAFVGALYAKSPDSFEELEANCRKMALAMSGKKEKILDLTLPIVSYFNGKGFNKGIIDCIGKNTMINDLILNFFCTSTDLCRSAQVVHTKGLCWKYVRASMSLHGYLPPIAENGQLLVDGGYTNIVPGDIMLEKMNAKAVICVDVSKETVTGFYEYGTSLSGLWLLFNSWNPFEKTVKVASMGELSQKLIWVQSTKKRSDVRANADLWLTPPVSNYGVLEYDKFDEIVQKGYDYAVPLVDAFIKENPWSVS